VGDADGKTWFWRLYGINLAPANAKGWIFMLAAMALFAISVGGLSDEVIARHGWEVKLRVFVGLATLFVYFVVAYAKSKPRPRRR
jgi:membrane protein implicated in regulation of membrane protease activity